MTSAAERRSLEEAIVDTVREPLIVLDGEFRVMVASRSFYRAFDATPQETEGRPLYALGNGQWNSPALRTLLEQIIPRHTTIEAYEIDHEFPTIGRRTMLLNARKVFYQGNNTTSLLLSIEDVTERRVLEREKDELLRQQDELLRQKDLLLQEMNHRVNNSLQIIASILLLKAQTVQSEETRQHLQDAHERVMAVATVQEQLHPTPFGTQIEAKHYLTRLCESLAASMIVDGQPVAIRVEAGEGATTSEQAVSMGLIATELVINALKHAFPDGAKGTIIVAFESSASAWRLAVSDAPGFCFRTLSASPLINTCARGPARSICSTAERPLPRPNPASTIIRSGLWRCAASTASASVAAVAQISCPMSASTSASSMAIRASSSTTSTRRVSMGADAHVSNRDANDLAPARRRPAKSAFGVLVQESLCRAPPRKRAKPREECGAAPCCIPALEHAPRWRGGA